jgi:hypothetical protein
MLVKGNTHTKERFGSKRCIEEAYNPIAGVKPMEQPALWDTGAGEEEMGSERREHET